MRQQPPFFPRYGGRDPAFGFHAAANARALATWSGSIMPSQLARCSGSRGSPCANARLTPISAPERDRVELPCHLCTPSQETGKSQKILARRIASTTSALKPGPSLDTFTRGGIGLRIPLIRGDFVLLHGLANVQGNAAAQVAHHTEQGLGLCVALFPQLFQFLRRGRVVALFIGALACSQIGSHRDDSNRKEDGNAKLR